MNAMSTLSPTVPTIHLPRLTLKPGSRAHRLLLAAGAAGPLLFASAYSLVGAARPGYNPLTDTISALSLGPSGWMQVANFVLFGLLTAVSALAWRAALAPGRGSTVIPVLKGLMGIGLVLAGLSVMDPAGAAAGSLHGTMHNVASYIALTGTWVSTFVFAARFAQEPRWRPWSIFAALSGLLVLAMLAGMGMALGHHGDAGLFERLASLATLPLSLAVAIRLLAGGCRISQP